MAIKNLTWTKIFGGAVGEFYGVTVLAFLTCTAIWLSHTLGDAIVPAPSGPTYILLGIVLFASPLGEAFFAWVFPSGFQGDPWTLIQLIFDVARTESCGPTTGAMLFWWFAVWFSAQLLGAFTGIGIAYWAARSTKANIATGTPRLIELLAVTGVTAWPFFILGAFVKALGVRHSRIYWTIGEAPSRDDARGTYASLRGLASAIQQLLILIPGTYASNPLIVIAAAVIGGGSLVRQHANYLLLYIFGTLAGYILALLVRWSEAYFYSRYGDADERELIFGLSLKTGSKAKSVAGNKVFAVKTQGAANAAK